MAQSTVELIVDASKATNPLKRVASETKKLEAATQKNSAAFTKTGREIKTAANGMKFFTDASGRARKVNGQFVTTAEAAAAGLNRQGKAAKKASKNVNQLGKAVRGLAAGFGIFQAGKFVIFKTAELERQTKSLEVLTGSLGNARSIIKELQQFGAVTPFTSTELIETAKRLKAFGFETKEVVDVTKRLADVAGATGADLGGIATAFGQIQAKGRLQGEELLQLQERGVSLQDELQKMYGLTADEFRKALEGGRISADAVNLALQNITDTGGKYANGAIAQSETLAGKFSTLVDGIERIAVTIGNTLSPVLKFVLDDTTTVINSIVKMMNQAAIAGKVGLSPKEQQRLLRQAGSEAEETQRRRQGLPATGFAFGALNNEEFQRLRNERFEDLMRQEGFKRGTLKAPVSAPTLKGNTGIPALLNRTSSAGATQTDPIVAQQQKFDALLLKKKQEGLLAAATTKEERAQLELVMAKFELNRQFPDLKESELQKLRDQLQTNFDLGKAEQKRVADTKAANNAKEEALKRQQAEAQRLEQLFGGIGQTISTGIVDTLMQAKSASEALSGVLNDVARQLLQLGVNSLLKAAFPGSGLFSGLLGFANGGRPPVGRPSVVGERGPELFVPDRAGTILPNGVGMGGGTTITVNVDASETSADASSGQGAQLGKAIGLAVQQELIKQKRPGGLIAAI